MTSVLISPVVPLCSAYMYGPTLGLGLLTVLSLAHVAQVSPLLYIRFYPSPTSPSLLTGYEPSVLKGLVRTLAYRLDYRARARPSLAARTSDSFTIRYSLVDFPLSPSLPPDRSFTDVRQTPLVVRPCPDPEQNQLPELGSQSQGLSHAEQACLCSLSYRCRRGRDRSCEKAGRRGRGIKPYI